LLCNDAFCTTANAIGVAMNHSSVGRKKIMVSQTNEQALEAAIEKRLTGFFLAESGAWSCMAHRG